MYNNIYQLWRLVYKKNNLNYYNRTEIAMEELNKIKQIFKARIDLFEVWYQTVL